MLLIVIAGQIAFLLI